MNIFSCHIGKNYQGAVLGFALCYGIVAVAFLFVRLNANRALEPKQILFYCGVMTVLG